VEEDKNKSHEAGYETENQVTSLVTAKKRVESVPMEVVWQ
jgi:hypothetical protein